MNQQQKEALKYYTCRVLEQNENMEEMLLSHGIPKKIVAKLNKALDVFFEVNQECIEKVKGK